MARRGKAFHMQFTAWDVINNTEKKGNAASITGWLSKNGAKFVATTNAVTEVLNADNSTSGLYDILITATEAENDTLTLRPRSVTADVVCERVYISMEQFDGPFAIVVHIQDALAVAVADATVRILNSTQTITYDEKLTDSLGNATFALAAGTYRARISKPGWTFTVPETLTVTADGSAIYSGSEVLDTTPPVGTQLLKGYCILPSDVAAEGCVISAYITKKNVLVDHSVLTNQKLEHTILAGVKLWDLILVQGVEYHLLGKTPEGVIFLTATITVTDTAVAWIDKEYTITAED